MIIKVVFTLETLVTAAFTHLLKTKAAQDKFKIVRDIFSVSISISIYYNKPFPVCFSNCKPLIHKAGQKY